MEDRNIISLSKCPDSETVLSVIESSDCVSSETAGMYCHILESARNVDKPCRLCARRW